MTHIINNKYLMIILSFLFACGVGACVPSGQDFLLYDNVVRIHVIANSDSEYDQQMKLRVRDEIIKVTETLLRGCDNTKRAQEILGANLEVLRCTAQNVCGDDYGAQAKLCREYYPTRDYTSFRLPAGQYHSLKITLGEGEGKNWWCVIYPSLCTSLSVKKSGIITDDGKYRIKFFIMEKLGEIIYKKQ